MSDTNICVLSGKLARDCIVRRMESGNAVVNFTLAISGNPYTKKGVETREVHWIPCFKWTRDADGYAAVLLKGAAVTITGTVESQTWEDKKTQQKRTEIRVKVDKIVPMERRERRHEDGQPSNDAPKDNSNEQDNPPF